MPLRPHCECENECEFLCIRVGAKVSASASVSLVVHVLTLHWPVGVGSSALVAGVAVQGPQKAGSKKRARVEWEREDALLVSYEADQSRNAAQTLMLQHNLPRRTLMGKLARARARRHEWLSSSNVIAPDVECSQEC